MTDMLIPDTSRFPSKNKTQNIKIGQKKDVEISESEKLWYRFNSQVKIIPKKLKFLIL